jgi:hypothetical protein
MTLFIILPLKIKPIKLTVLNHFKCSTCFYSGKFLLAALYIGIHILYFIYIIFIKHIIYLTGFKKIIFILYIIGSFVKSK